jgi:putative hemolysin
MSEMALASSRKAGWRPWPKRRRRRPAALGLLDHPTQFLSTVQVGITSIGILNGIIGEAAFSERLAHWLQGLRRAARARRHRATAIVVAIITYVTIIFGELVPKRIGQLYPESVARWRRGRCAGWPRPPARSSSCCRPRRRRCSSCCASTPPRPRGMTEEEIAHSLEEGVDAGVIEQHEHQMVRNVFHLDDRPLTSMMMPRSDIEWLDAVRPPREACKRAGEGEATPGTRCAAARSTTWSAWSAWRACCALGPATKGPVEPHAVPARSCPRR